MPPSRTHPTRRKSSPVRRREIAEAVLAVIGERGAAALTTASLAERVGLTPGALFRHFASLDEILEAAVELGARRLEGTFPPAGLPPRERLLRLARARIELLAGEPGLAWLLLSDQARLRVPERAARRLGGLVERSRDFLLEALRQGAAEGSLRSDLAPEIGILVFRGLVHGLIGGRGLHGGDPGPSSPRRAPTLDEALAALMLLLSPPTGPEGPPSP